MFRKLVASLFLLPVLAVYAPLSLAEFRVMPEVPAFGLTDGVAGCDLTDAGLVVNFSATLPSPFNGIAQRGDACLPILAEFPPPYPTLGFVQLNGNGSDDTVLIGADHMVWVVHDPKKPEAVIGCTLNEDGVLETTLIANGNGEGALGDPCVVTLAAFSAQGRSIRGPVAATLGADSEGTGGGVVWYHQGPGFIGVILCDVDASTGEFVVTHHENSRDGVIDASTGQSCLGIIAEDVEGEALAGPVTGPVPVPQGTTTQVLECLVWIIDNGSVSQ